MRDPLGRLSEDQPDAPSSLDIGGIAIELAGILADRYNPRPTRRTIGNVVWDGLQRSIRKSRLHACVDLG
jgi:hypothetical protein